MHSQICGLHVLYWAVGQGHSAYCIHSPTSTQTPLLAVGDTIPINYNNKRYFIDIIEAKPGSAISVIETDCNVSCGGPLLLTVVVHYCCWVGHVYQPGSAISVIETECNVS